MKSPTRSKKAQAIKLFSENKMPEAKELFERVCKVDRLDIESWVYLAKINTQLGNPAAVERCCRTIINLRPDILEAHFQLGQALLLKGEQEAAAEKFQHVLRFQPNNPKALFQLGKICHIKKQFDDAMTYYRRALASAPNLHEAYSSIGSILKYRGDVEGGIECYRRAMQISQGSVKVHSDLVFAMNYSPRYDATAIFQEHVRWGQANRLPPVKSPAYNGGLQPDRRLRVGYVSPDFYRHAVAFFFEPLLANHDRDRVEVFCYSDVAKPDDFTQRLQSAASHWRPCLGMSDSELAEQIRRDGIDILVDLTGHTANNRLLAFTARPAPVQVTYLGYPNTTGVPAVDYRLTDEWADPPGVTDTFHTEALIRLPQGFLCYMPAKYAPAVSPLPAKENGQITFGSFNNLAKITPEVLALWAEVLRAVPGSRLVIKNMSFADAPTREHYLQLLMGHDIYPGRLDLLPPINTNEQHLGAYGKIDIALDTFPYNGTTTTCDALWMGVPCITLSGSMHAGRVGVSLLSQVGLENLVAQTPQDYVRIAKEIASDLDRLAELRAGLRDRMARSSLCDGKAFARKVENAYSEIWRDYCAKTQSGFMLEV